MQKSYFGRLRQWIHIGSACVSSEYYCRTTESLKSAVTRLTTSCGVYFASESIVSRYRTLTNWNDASTANGPLCVTRSLNMLSANGVSVYALAFVLEADIFSKRDLICFWDDVMTRVTVDTVTASCVCCYSVNHSNIHLIIALTAQSDTSNFPR